MHRDPSFKRFVSRKSLGGMRRSIGGFRKGHSHHPGAGSGTAVPVPAPAPPQPRGIKMSNLQFSMKASLFQGDDFRLGRNGDMNV